jgi:hypothetical protein
VQVLHIVGFKRHRAIQKCEQDYSCTPQICLESLVALVSYNFWCYVRGSTTLLLHNLPFLYSFRDTKVCDLDLAFAVQKNVVELDVTMKNFFAVDVPNALNYLFEEDHCDLFIKLFSLSNEV